LSLTLHELPGLQIAESAEDSKAGKLGKENRDKLINMESLI